MVIPWDPGHSAAYDLGVGIAKSRGLTTFGVDAIYEPIRTHTWGETPAPIVTDWRHHSAGGKTTENHFRFSNAILRTGIGQEIPIDTVRGTLKSIRLELGLALRSIGYTLNQIDHVRRRRGAIDRAGSSGRAPGASAFGSAISSCATPDARRPEPDGQASSTTVSSSTLAAAADRGPEFSLGAEWSDDAHEVVVTTHQISVSVPIR